MAEPPALLLHARLDGLSQPMARRYWAKLQLTDHVDHIEYTDGKRVRRWRLADQPGDEPILATVLIVRYPMLRWTSACEAVVFLDPDGHQLGRFIPHGGGPIALISQVLPHEAYAPLRSRGVEIRRQQLASADRFHRTYPNLNANPIVRELRRPSPRYLGSVVGATVVITLIVMALQHKLI